MDDIDPNTEVSSCNNSFPETPCKKFILTVFPHAKLGLVVEGEAECRNLECYLMLVDLDAVQDCKQYTVVSHKVY